MSTITAPELLYQPETGQLLPPDVGGKARGLAAIPAAGLVTAPWFVVRAEAQRSSSSGAADATLAAEVEAACGRLVASGAHGFAVRSSALDEDGSSRSFAGQHLTVLNAPDARTVLTAIEQCWASASGPAALAYRAAHGISTPPPGLAVVIQAMVPALVSGVSFTRPPDGISDEIVIVAARGLGPPLVGGEIDGDEYRVTGDGGVTVRRVAPQPWRLEAWPGGGLVRTELPPSSPRRCLDDDQAREVARAAARLAACCGAPQDVEWAYTADGSLVVLQTRPITALRSAGPDDPVRLWDNANIVESFPGLTLPLTFSVARESYASVYRQACRAVGVSARTIAEHEAVFEQMLGLISGRVYYNLNSWHELLSLLPGFRFNQGFLERMMGAQRPGEVVPAVAPRRKRLTETSAMLLRLLWRLATFEREARRFQCTIEDLSTSYRAHQFAGESPDRFLEQFDAVRRRSLDAWRPPILNDLFLMVFHGALRRSADRWLGSRGDELVNTLLRSGSLPSVEPAQALLAIAARVRAEPRWQVALAETPATAFGARLRTDPDLRELRAMVEAYIDRWGDRCPEELQLDRATYRQDPAPLFRLLRAHQAKPSMTSGRNSLPRAAAEANRVLRETGPVSGLLRWAIFWLLIRRTRYHLRWREQMRFMRGQVFALARHLFTATGKGLAARGMLDDTEDIHYLDVQEIRSAIRGTGAVGDLRPLVRARRATYRAYRGAPDLPNRFETRGPVGLARPSAWQAGPAQPQGGRLLRGTGACPGRVRAPVVVVSDPREVETVAGRIAVAKSTDPGWVPIFVTAVGLLVERGSLLSHSAIVARELGLPTVVGLPGLTTLVTTGQLVELDGSTGEVWLEPGEPQP